MLRVLSRPTLSGRREPNPVSSHLPPKQLATHPCLVHMAVEPSREVRAPGGGCTLQGGGDARSSAFARLIVSGRGRSRQAGSKRSILPDMCPDRRSSWSFRSSSRYGQRSVKTAAPALTATADPQGQSHPSEVGMGCALESLLWAPYATAANDST